LDKLYENSKITNDEATLLLIGYISSNKLSRKASEQLLTLVNFFLPVETAIPESVYSLKNSMPCTSNITSKHYYCQECQEYLETDGDETSSTISCSSCNYIQSRESLSLNSSYFLVFDVKAQMELILRSKDIASKLYHRLLVRNSQVDDGIFRDIIDGTIYKSLSLEGNDLSTCVNTDGVPVFNSSKFSVWPILLSLNELAYRDRCNNTINHCNGCNNGIVSNFEVNPMQKST
jgi:hypothetical protein